MEVWLWYVIGILVLIVVILCIKIYLLQKSMIEIQHAFAEKIQGDTNTLIDISSRDRHVCRLAATINTELRHLRSERHRFLQGDLELKEAVSNISHDLRTPLTAICGYLDLLEQEEKSDTISRYLDIIKNRTEVLKQLTEELFCYSIAVSVPKKDDYEELSLNGVLEESLSAYYAVLKEQKIEPTISIPEQKVIRVLSRSALLRIFGNIISNAVKYSDGDLNIVLYENGEIVFSNYASGLDEVEVGKLFNRFYTVETGKKSTGLGLSIAKILTEQMGGKIEAEWRDGRIRIRVELF